MIKIIFWFFGLVCIYGASSDIYNVESEDIHEELIYRYNTLKTFNKTDNREGICKNDVCFKSMLEKPFIELPDTNGTLHIYIVEPYESSYDVSPKLLFSTKCKSNEQCFSDKCVNNTCIRNLQSKISRCDTLYTRPHLFISQKKSIHCGRMLGDPCDKNDECSSNYCEKNYCYENPYRPSDTDTMNLNMEYLGLIGGIVIFALITACFCSIKQGYTSLKNQINKPKK
ncbi:hypothetical protein U3516DRAFT_917247 [Neocallimastix sp. 'constans']|jgi:hypothetical protein